MTKRLLVMANDAVRQKAARWVLGVPEGSRVTFQPPKRTLPQNDRMWAILTEISEQATYHGIKLSPDDWKLLFLDALKREVRMVPNLDSTGLVSLGRSSSDLGKEEFSDLLEIITAWCAQNDVRLSQ